MQPMLVFCQFDCSPTPTIASQQQVPFVRLSKEERSNLLAFINPLGLPSTIEHHLRANRIIQQHRSSGVLPTNGHPSHQTPSIIT